MAIALLRDVLFRVCSGSYHAEAVLPAAFPVIIKRPQARKPLDRMRVHARDGQTYVVRVDSMP